MIFFIIILLSFLALYFVIGFVFALFFIFKGLSVVDPDAAEAGWGVKLLLFPGSIAFWVILWRKWSISKKNKGL
ncbi:MAG: hypothetical protein NW226_19685 [Microscillaceae bacterium]|nr:hypothetical protein [Microscillaceae bacterium]